MTPGFSRPSSRGSAARGPLIAVAAAVVVVLAIGLPVWFFGSDRTPVAADSTTTTVEETTTTVADTTTTTEETTTTVEETTTTLESERLDYGPPEGSTVVSIGLPPDERLPFLAEARPDAEVLAELSLDDETIAQGVIVTWGREHGYYEVTFNGQLGYVPAPNAAVPGMVHDVTARVVAVYEGIPFEQTLEDLAERVAETVEAERRVIVSVGDPGDSDLAEVMIDVLDFRDDAVGGERLHIFAVPHGGGWQMRTVEATVWCLRGADPDGFCQ